MNKKILTVCLITISICWLDSLYGQAKIAVSEWGAYGRDAGGSRYSDLDQVNDKRSSGQLTSAQAAELRQQATAIQQQIGCTTTASASAGTANSQSNSPLENMIDSALSNVGPTHSEQTDKARDTIHKGLDLYSDFFGSK